MRKGLAVAIGIVCVIIFAMFVLNARDRNMRYGGTYAAKITPAPHASRYWKNFIKPDTAVLRTQLTPLQFTVTQQEGTETPYRNEYWHNEDSGIYVDIVSGEPLFSSLDKYESHTGWPSFTRPLEPDNIILRTDTILGFERTEVRSKIADSHLGHLFDDGPAPAGLRYCMNSAAMRFIPAANLATEGYEEYVPLFQ